MQPRKDDPRFVRLGSVKTFLVGLGGLGAVGWVDWMVTSAISVSSFYLFPVAFVTWYLGGAAGVTMSCLAACVWFLAEYGEGTDYAHSIASVWQAGSRFIFYLVTTFLVNRIRILTVKMEKLVKDRTAALDVEIARSKALEREASEIAEREQERVAHELHDQLAGYLAGIAFRARSLSEQMDRRSAPEASQARHLAASVNEATDQVRNLARLLAPIEGHEGFCEALTHLGAEAETVYGVTCLVEISEAIPELPTEQVVQLCRIAQEAVRNAIRHSQADWLKIAVSLEGARLKLSVDCNGKAWDRTNQSPAGLGLRIMRHRAEKLAGALSIEPNEHGSARITCLVPIGACGSSGWGQRT